LDLTAVAAVIAAVTGLTRVLLEVLEFIIQVTNQQQAPSSKPDNNGRSAASGTTDVHDRAEEGRLLPPQAPPPKAA
jgi:hypothetical protein